MLKSTLTSLAFAAAIALPVWADPAITAFDVAEDHTRFVFAPAPVHENGMPAYGNPFVTQGYIYPSGILGEGQSGVNEDGSPAYPDLVLGTWTCDGWFVADGGNTKSGTWLISRQTYEFSDGGILISQGPELADIGKPVRRPITGATGSYADNEGVIQQTLLGFNEHMGVEARFVIPVGSDRPEDEDGARPQG